MDHNTDKEIMELIENALSRDLPLHPVIQKVEKQIIHNARQRHSKNKDVYKALKIPKSSYYDKKRAFYHSHTPPHP